MKTPTNLKIILLVLCLSVALQPTFAQKKRKKSKKPKSSKVLLTTYIDNYKTIAMAEMKRTNIPASITLAQGILESNHGNSYLAKKGKNHFGIKCHRSWRGQRVYAWDDEKRRSCFRKYPSSYASFIDHSNFLINNQRYDELLLLPNTNYEEWAKGLKKAGYATDPNYAKQLVSIIEKYDLRAYDVLLASNLCDEEIRAVPFTYNGIKTLLLGCDVEPETLVRTYGIQLKKLLKYNNLASNDTIVSGQFVFLEKTKRKGPKGIEQHRVNEGETMEDIARLYGIRLKSLYRRNKMKQGMKPAVGETVSLRKKARKKPLLASEVIGPTEMEENVETIVTEEKTKAREEAAKEQEAEKTVAKANLFDTRHLLADLGTTIKRKSSKPVTVTELSTPMPAVSSKARYNKKTSERKTRTVPKKVKVKKPKVKVAKKKVVKKKKVKSKKVKTALAKKGKTRAALKKEARAKRKRAKANKKKGKKYQTAIIYLVKKGDTLGGIAKKHGISLRSLKKANKIKSHLIYPEQPLIVPQKR